ncbi:2-methylaconitate cis-trans isomerase PrpF [Orrella marina]|uniref:2-methylaconitate cis-trans isomerase PrpF n=1 Tax=Orrella marina TaxID=2163011 RepID=A0A2R4XNP5_9BURK|nr:2-methylaconitate cis-trans isomerase PrpF [Orrella marina]AWB35405.1 2-methylaconitate cis-trans isomerase PrpF [Orrella marina]
MQVPIRATYMRGGTSKGVFFLAEDLPEDPVIRDQVLMRVIGSPDPYGQHIDGMGAATSSTSKIVIISASDRPDSDIDYLFGQVSIDKPLIDWSGNCGNLTAAVGPFAIHRGLISPGEACGITIRIWQANIRKRILAHVPVREGQVLETGEFKLDGVAFPAAEIRIEFLDPGASNSEAGEDGQAGVSGMFPTGNRIDELEVPGFGTLSATMIMAGNPAVFVSAASLGLTGKELQVDLNSNHDLLDRLEQIRAHAAVRMGLGLSVEEVSRSRQHTPKLAFFAKPDTYTASDGKTVSADNIDLLARILSMGKLHHAMTGTGAVGIAAAAAIEGTVVSQILGHARNDIVFGHPSGVLRIGADVHTDASGQAVVNAVKVSRSARRLMDGQVFVPSSCLQPLDQASNT